MIKQISYKIAVCDLCGKEERFDSVYSYPSHLGWRSLTIGSPSYEERNYEICPQCTEKVVAIISVQ